MCDDDCCLFTFGFCCGCSNYIGLIGVFILDIILLNNIPSLYADLTGSRIITWATWELITLGLFILFCTIGILSFTCDAEDCGICSLVFAELIGIAFFIFMISVLESQTDNACYGFAYQAQFSLPSIISSIEGFKIRRMYGIEAGNSTNLAKIADVFIQQNCDYDYTLRFWLLMCASPVISVVVLIPLGICGAGK